MNNYSPIINFQIFSEFKMNQSASSCKKGIIKCKTICQLTTCKLNHDIHIKTSKWNNKTSLPQLKLDTHLNNSLIP